MALIASGSTTQMQVQDCAGAPIGKEKMVMVTGVVRPCS